MDKILLISAIYHGFIHFLIIWYQIQFKIFSFYNLILLFGVISSILNHGMTNNIIKIIDRLIMLIGAFYDYILILYYLFTNYHNNKQIIILIILLETCSILLYFASYQSRFTKPPEMLFNIIPNYYYYHILSHSCLTINHILIMLILQ